MTDPDHKAAILNILNLIQTKGPMNRVGLHIGLNSNLMEFSTTIKGVAELLSSGALSEVGSLIATPEQAAIIDVLRGGPKDLDAPLDRTPVGFPVVDPEDGPPLLGDLSPGAFDALVASGHVVRTERECGTCGGSGLSEGPLFIMADPEEQILTPCPHCTDGKQITYELSQEAL